MINEISKEQARSIEERYYKNPNNSSYTSKDYIISFIESNFDITSIEEFIVRINELDMTEKILQFKNELQYRIRNEPDCLLVYFAVKDFITDKRLELLYEMRDKRILECMDKYSNWRIKDTIMNTKWKYMNRAFSPSNPIIDQLHKKQYENIKAASEANGISEEDIKSNFGYKKRLIYISDYTQFLNSLPVHIKRPCFRGKECTFNNIKEASKVLWESADKIRYCINNKKRIFIGHGKMEYEIRSISFGEQFMLFSPIIVGEDEYPDMCVASSFTLLKVKDMLQNFGGCFEIDNTEYTVRPALDTNHISKDRQLPFEEDKKFVNEVYSKIKEIRDKYSLKYLFKITSPAAQRL